MVTGTSDLDRQKDADALLYNGGRKEHMFNTLTSP